MLALLVEAGMFLVGPDAAADVCIINTCGFIEDARTEAFEAIEEALEAKKVGRIGHVVVVGCLAQYWQEKLYAQFGDIDAVIGLGNRSEIAQLVRKIAQSPATDAQRQPMIACGPLPDEVPSDQARLRLTERCWAYLRISEGCSLNCTFCSIPLIRGAFHSKALDQIIAEAQELIADGAVELNLIGQETTGYGRDLGYKDGLATLLREMNQLENLRWLRILYAHPATITTEQIETMARCEKVVPYLDLPLQHINDRILRLMNRRINRRQTENLISRLRSTIDNLTIRTTMLVGFPSETDQEFAELLDFIREYRFEALGGFIFSPEQGTPAARLAGQIAPQIKQQRHEKLMLTQQKIAFEKAESLIGCDLDCLITAELATEKLEAKQLDKSTPWFLGRHSGQAAQIDSECYVPCDNNTLVEPGSIVPVTIEARKDYDLIAKFKR